MHYIAFVLLLLCTGCQYNVADSSSNDYRLELEQIVLKIKNLRQKQANANKQKAIEFIYYLYRYASLTNNFGDYKKTETALQQAFDRFGPDQQLYLFRANFNFKLHRLDAAMADLIELDRYYGDSPQGEILKADIALQNGQYHIAEKAYAAMCKENPSWDNLARLAYFKLHTGEAEKADLLYRQAQDLLSVKQMRQFAWLELQRGLIDLEFRRYRNALIHYIRAERAYSGYWLIREHIAEAYTLLGHRDEAVKLYQVVIEQTRNPEFINALAAIYEAEGNPMSTDLYARADQLFNDQYRLFPEAAVGHFVESLLKRRQVDERVLNYARRNHEWRSNSQAKYLLARSYQKLGKPAKAKRIMEAIQNSRWWSGDIAALSEELSMK